MSGYVVVVNSVEDSTSQPNMCSPMFSDQEMCSLRNALLYCAQNASAMERECVIELPEKGELFWNSSVGSVVINDPIGDVNLVVNGRGASVSPYSHNGDVVHSSLLSIDGSGSSNKNIGLSVDDTTFSNFGEVVFKLQFLDDLKFSNCAFVNNTGTNGGCIFMDEIYGVEIKNCEFLENSATSGGALYFNMHVTDLNISDSRFIENRATVSGGAAYLYEYIYDVMVDNTEFIDNSAVENGGALFLYEYHEFISIYNCIFVGNAAQEGSGGAVYFEEDSHNFTLSGTVLKNNSATNGNGKSRVCLVVLIVITGNTIYITGGALYFYSKIYGVYVTNATFTDNFASSGGGIFVYTKIDSLVISESEFSGNWAEFSGGGILIFIESYDIIVSNSIFKSNLALGGDSIDPYDGTKKSCGGGALYIDIANEKVALVNCTIEENYAVYASGGAVFVGIDNVDVTLEYCVLNSNYAYRSGGAIFSGFANFALILNYCQVSNNVAKMIGGGGLSAIAQNLITIKNSVLSSNA